MQPSFTFGMLRFSRLYPLHFVTLLYVAALQPVFLQHAGRYFVYTDNSPTSFVLQLLFASNWWVRPYSFNGPIWSVSVEVVLYLSFFIVARYAGMKPLILLAIGIAGIFLMPVNEEIGRGFSSFYVGCLCGIVVSSAKARQLSLGACLALAAMVVLWSQTSISRAELIVKWLAFPGAVIVLALTDDKLVWMSRRLHWLGDISYSSYLIHFPLQLTLVTVATLLGLTIDSSSPLTLAVFFAAFIGLSLMSFRFFERPVMRLIRARSIHPPTVAALPQAKR